MPDFSDAIDALFFGQGQYHHPMSPIPANGSWHGFRAGSAITIRISSSVSPMRATEIRQFVDEIDRILPGLYRISIETQSVSLDDSVRDGRFVPGQIHVAELSSNGGRHPCQPTGSECAPYVLGGGGVIEAAHVVLGAASTKRTVHHELVHALLGLGHFFIFIAENNDRFSWWERPIMNEVLPSVVGTDPDVLSSLESEILRAVVEAGLRPGDSRDTFRSRGMIR